MAYLRDGKGRRVLPAMSAAEAVRRNMEYVDLRRKGLITSLRTKYPRLDSYLMGRKLPLPL